MLAWRRADPYDLLDDRLLRPVADPTGARLECDLIGWLVPGVFAFVGAFGGAAIGEYWRAQNADEALRVGFWAFVGRSAAAMAKVAMGLGIIWIIIVKTW